MATATKKCSMCGTRNLVESPHKDAESIIFLMCPNCDLNPMGISIKNTYDGVGPR